MNKAYLKDIGKLDRLLTIRKHSSYTRDRFGHVTAITATDTELYAALSFANRDEKNESDKETTIEYLHFIIRPEIDNLNTKDQALYNSNVYDIINIEEIGRNKFLKLKLKRVV